MERSTEERILEAAKKVFLTKGMAGARMQDIADEAGINKAMLHYYFRSKEKLFEEIFRQVSGQLMPRINQLLEADLPLFEKIYFFCEEYIERMLQNPFIPLFLVNEANVQQGEFLEKHWGNQRPNLRMFADQVEREAAQGLIKPVHPMQLFLNMVSMCIFPFLSKPILQYVSGMEEDAFRQLMAARKREIPQFIINSIRN
ncbi:TetR/AcrR family transcriptional regulator [Pontibacter chitinilyticus]|uniref:TetR/AcrR family transcriptional regulator n=1 Tax=Pontibacter chitinilyticus TaxID=2674989 RepID=UPI003218E713